MFGIDRFVSDTTVRDLSSKDGLKVIAVGLPRCATSSLQSALENELGCGPCMHMAYVAPYPELLKLCHDAMLETDKQKRQKMLHTLFDGYVSSADVPGTFFADDLMEMYPDAKIILNTRNSAQKWLTSIRYTLYFFSTKSYYCVCYLLPTDYWMYHVQEAVKKLWWRRHAISSPDGFYVLETYDKHNQWVKDAAKRQGKSVLEWQPQHGWAPLCESLGKPVPKTEFPHLNDEAFVKKLHIFLLVRGLLAWAALLSLPVVAFWAWGWMSGR
ncbi:hypothetical protein MMC13_001784 [Lambiella insularis]|nr:hypothetical protein [Lambiella insularis]